MNERRSKSHNTEADDSIGSIRVQSGEENADVRYRDKPEANALDEQGSRDITQKEHDVELTRTWHQYMTILPPLEHTRDVPILTGMSKPPTHGRTSRGDLQS